ncbi:MAG: hypothetical protein WD294_09475 [Phycisphaeraceae bacterium]
MHNRWMTLGLLSLMTLVGCCSGPESSSRTNIPAIHGGGEYINAAQPRSYPYHAITYTEAGGFAGTVREHWTIRLDGTPSSVSDADRVYLVDRETAEWLSVLVDMSGFWDWIIEPMPMADAFNVTIRVRTDGAMHRVRIPYATTVPERVAELRDRLLAEIEVRDRLTDR